MASAVTTGPLFQQGQVSNIVRAVRLALQHFGQPGTRGLRIAVGNVEPREIQKGRLISWIECERLLISGAASPVSPAAIRTTPCRLTASTFLGSRSHDESMTSRAFFGWPRFRYHVVKQDAGARLTGILRERLLELGRVQAPIGRSRSGTSEFGAQVGRAAGGLERALEQGRCLADSSPPCRPWPTATSIAGRWAPRPGEARARRDRARRVATVEVDACQELAWSRYFRVVLHIEGEVIGGLLHVPQAVVGQTSDQQQLAVAADTFLGRDREDLRSRSGLCARCRGPSSGLPRRPSGRRRGVPRRNGLPGRRPPGRPRRPMEVEQDPGLGYPCIHIAEFSAMAFV